MTRKQHGASLAVRRNKRPANMVYRNFPRSERERLTAALRERVLYQDEAIGHVVGAYVRWRAGLAGTDKPIAAFASFGPTGCGKTLLPESLAEVLHGDRNCMVKIHCAEYQQEHEIAKLIGAPPGYVGHEKNTARLGKVAIQKATSPNCGLTVVLFDEIEKANHSLWELLLGALDKGDLHTGDGQNTDMRQCMIFFTSNLGEKAMQNTAGFFGHKRTITDATVRKTFSPEFVNRLTSLINFNHLTDEQLVTIADLELKRSAARAKKSPSQVVVTWSADVPAFILAQCQHRQYGARPLRRAIEKFIEEPLAEEIIGIPFPCGTSFHVCVANGQLAYQFKRAKPA